jgi:hypothetical protein
MKFCKDCKWLQGLNGDECHSPKNFNAGNDLVTGEKKQPTFTYAIHHRMGSGTSWIGCRIYDLCGKEARWFEPKS